MFNRFPGSMQYLWSKILLSSTEKNEIILILISSKRYFWYPKKSVLNLVFLNLKKALLFWAQGPELQCLLKVKEDLS